jgi:HlyD family secretion protein
MIPPNDIDRVHQGGPARVRFTSFDRTTTPELIGHIVWISPDQEVVSENRRPAFKVRIGLKKDELKRLGRSAIGPGMEAEVMLTGPKRTALSFLLKPMTDQLERTFRER